MENPWPSIENVEKTDKVISYFNEISESLKQNYNGKIQSELIEIQYAANTALPAGERLSALFRPIEKNDESKKEVLTVEEGKEQVCILKTDYKYEIFNDHLYYKLFTITIPEYFPLKMRVSFGILEDKETEIEIMNLRDLKDKFTEIVCSDKVRNIIKKMCE